MVYVAVAGHVSTLPQGRSFLLDYGQAAVCTPSNAAFPSNATAEAEPGTEAVVISDLDLANHLLSSTALRRRHRRRS